MSGGGAHAVGDRREGAEGFLLPRCYHSIRPQGEPGLSAVSAPSRCLARLEVVLVLLSWRTARVRNQ